MKEEHDVPLASRTTLGLGGPARRLVRCETEAEIVSAVAGADEAGVPLFVLGGGSNVVVADEGFPGLVVEIASAGVEPRASGDRVEVEVAAGEDWDGFVARAVAEGWSGIECLAGIPGRVGATPIQNVGAYGQDVAQTLAYVRVFDRRRGAVVTLDARTCGFSYRNSRFKGDRICPVVLSVGFVLDARGRSRPLAYEALCRTLGASAGDDRPLDEVRRTVIALRRRKGMVLDRTDPDSVSAGSFFTNPILDIETFRAFEARARALVGSDAPVPRYLEDDRVKVPAAWLVERAGFLRGHTRGAFRVSTKHALALVHSGGGTTRELLAFEAEIRAAVGAVFGVTLEREPVLVGESYG